MTGALLHMNDHCGPFLSLAPVLVQVSDYKVKVMIAEPKGKRGRRDPLFSDAFAHAIQQPGLEFGSAQLGPYSAMSEPPANTCSALFSSRMFGCATTTARQECPLPSKLRSPQ